MPLPRQVPELAVLDLLVTVAAVGSLGRAATLHGISQPAASLRIQALERRLGLQLLTRGPTGSRLTPAGESVVGWAQPVLDAAEQFASAVETLRGAQAGRVLVAASLTIADELFPQWLTALHRHNNAVVSLRVANSATVAELVRSGAVALGFVEGPAAPPGLRSRVVGGDDLVVVVGREHRWARRRNPLTAAALAAEPLVLREPGSGTREAFDEALAALGLSARAGVELGSTTALKAAAIAGEGPTVVSRLSVTTEVADRRLVVVPVADVDLRRTFRAVWSRDRPPGGDAAVLVAVAAQQRRTP